MMITGAMSIQGKARIHRLIFDTGICGTIAQAKLFVVIVLIQRGIGDALPARALACCMLLLLSG
jgi:hypothetical protein